MDSTRISDLPNQHIEENITYQLQQQQHANMTLPMQPMIFPNPESTIREKPDEIMSSKQMANDLGKTNYMPLNVHPNPYASDPPAPPASTEMLQHAATNAPPSVIESSARPIEDYIPKQPRRIPPNEISIDPLDYTQDEEIQANYIAKPLSKIKVRDYIKEYDENEGARLYEHETKKAKEVWYKELFHQSQFPLLLFLVFFIFQMQITKRTFTLIFSRFGKWILNDAGEATNLGMILKASIFTLVYLVIHWVLNHI